MLKGLITIAVLAAVSLPARAQFVGSLNGVSVASTFEINGITPLPAYGWSTVSGSARIFDASANGAMISTQPYANYSVRHATGVAVQPNTAYTLTFDMGFVSGNSGGAANYQFTVGTIDALNVFTPLGTAKAGTASYAGNLGFGFVSRTDSQTVTTGAAVSGHQLAVEWAQVSTTGPADYFGFDNVRLQFTPVPEPATTFAVGAGALALAGFARRAWRKSAPAA